MIKYRVDIIAFEPTKNRFNTEYALAKAIRKDSEKYVPMKSGALRQSATIIGTTINYYGPYARYVWEGKRMVNAATGKGPRYIPTVGYRWPKGARLIPTGQPLHYHTAGTGDHWIEIARRHHMKKWKNIVAKELMK